MIIAITSVALIATIVVVVVLLQRRGASTPPRPYFASRDMEMFDRYLNRARVYFEYGSGASTLYAGTKPHIQKIYSVESDRAWAGKVRSQVCSLPQVTLLFTDIHAKPNNWGYPGTTASRADKIKYSSQILRLPHRERQSIDFILIDGRFRVACCLKCFDIEGCVVAFDDFLDRPKYHVVLDYFDIIESTADRRMVMLRKKRHIRAVPMDLIERYDVIPD